MLLSHDYGTAPDGRHPRFKLRGISAKKEVHTYAVRERATLDPVIRDIPPQDTVNETLLTDSE